MHTFDSGRSGPAILVFGGIHGNEHCGTRAIEQVIGQLNTGALRLQRGSVRFVPVCNPGARERGLRYIDADLNCIFRRGLRPEAYEGALTADLCRHVRDCDALLDIHSTTSETVPFVSLGYPSPDSLALAESLGPTIILMGTPAFRAYAKRVGRYTTGLYASEHGKPYSVVECGQHAEEAAARVAYRAVINCMRHFGVIEGPLERRPLEKIAVQDIFVRQEGEKLANLWRNFEL